jgi:hypothetical protein
MGRFLVGNAHLSQLGGSETFTYAFVGELVRLGHEVDVICASHPYGVIGDQLAEMWITVNRPSIRGRAYDAAFLSHDTTVEMLFRLFPYFPPEKVVQTIHGSVPTLEAPYLSKPIQYVVISDELREKYPMADVIMNGVNLDRFRPGVKVPGSVLSLCQSESFNAMLSEICAELGLTFKSRNKFTNPIWNIEDELATAEIAIGIGRSAIEAMACGCAVLIADHRPYQGALTDGWAANHEIVRHTNYSGRWLNAKATRSTMTATLEAGKDQDDACYYRRIAAEHHDIRKQVAKYLEMVS